MARMQEDTRRKGRYRGALLVVILVALVVLVLAGLTYAKANGWLADPADKITNIELMPGQSVFAAPGTEFIVRKGKTLAVSRDGEGIADVTDGKDLLPDASIDENHLLVFPKDTRGVKADPTFSGEIWIMIRGGFTVYDANGNSVAPVSE